MDDIILFGGIALLGLVMTGVLIWATVRFLRMAREGKTFSSTADPRKANTPEAISKLPVDDQIVKMRKSIRSWAWVMLVMGGLSLVAGQVFSSPWGVIQILIGLASFYFYSDYAMFMVYTGAFAWAAVLNLASGTSWAVGGLLQLFWAYQNYRLFTTYQTATRAAHAAATPADPTASLDGPAPLWEQDRPQEDTRAQKVFAWLSLFLGLGGMVGFGLLFLGVITLTLLKVDSQAVSPLVDFLFDLSALISVMGVPFAIASIRGGYRPKAASIIGLVCGMLMVAVYIWLAFRR